MPDMTQSDRNAHEQADELLPWYATGQLEDHERSRVEAHLAHCGECQRQLAAEQRLVDEFHGDAPEVDEAGWTRLRARIATPAPKRQRRNWIAEAGEDLRRIFSRPVYATLAAAEVAFVAFAAWFLPFASQPAYQALGSSRAPASANVIVMFRADATEADMRGALQVSDATLVGGPTSADAYLLHVPAKEREAALTRLRADDDVTLAQPIDQAP